MMIILGTVIEYIGISLGIAGVTIGVVLMFSGPKSRRRR